MTLDEQGGANISRLFSLMESGAGGLGDLVGLQEWLETQPAREAAAAGNNLAAAGDPSTGSEDEADMERRHTKVLPASSGAPKYKFVLPNEYVHKYMQHLVEQPFRLVDGSGGSWDVQLIQRRNKDKYEYMVQHWKRYAEPHSIQEGDTVVFEMQDEDSLLLTVVERADGVTKKSSRARNFNGPTNIPIPAAPPPPNVLQRPAARSLPASKPKPVRVGTGQPHGAGQQQRQRQGGGVLHEVETSASTLNGVRGEMALHAPSPGVSPHALGAAAVAALPGGGLPNGASPADLLNFIQEQQIGLVAMQQQQQVEAIAQQAAAAQQQLLQGMAGQLANGRLAGGQLPDLSAVISQLGKRQRLEETAASGHPGRGSPLERRGDGQQRQHQQQQHHHQYVGGGMRGSTPERGGAGGAQPNNMRLLSEVADLDQLMQENMSLREELRLAQNKVQMLETGVLNIKSVLQKNTDPGLIAMTGIINLLNQMDSAEFLPDLGPIERVALDGLCAEVRRHLNSVLRMVWILRSLPDDAQRQAGMQDAQDF